MEEERKPLQETHTKYVHSVTVYFHICLDSVGCFHAIPKNLNIQTMKKLIILKLNNVDLNYSNVSKRCRHNGKQ